MGQLSRTVPRGVRRSNAADLLGEYAEKLFRSKFADFLQ